VVLRDSRRCRQQTEPLHSMNAACAPGAFRPGCLPYLRLNRRSFLPQLQYALHTCCLAQIYHTRLSIISSIYNTLPTSLRQHASNELSTDLSLCYEQFAFASLTPLMARPPVYNDVVVARPTRHYQLPLCCRLLTLAVTTSRLVGCVTTIRVVNSLGMAGNGCGTPFITSERKPFKPWRFHFEPDRIFACDICDEQRPPRTTPR